LGKIILNPCLLERWFVPKSATPKHKRNWQVEEKMWKEERVGKWNGDGKNGLDDPHTSMRILLDWWTTEGNYSRFCGKHNDGIKKIQFASSLANTMTEETPKGVPKMYSTKSST
jgi:hypothetical protein